MSETIVTTVLTWLQFVVVTDLSGQMLTFDSIWHFWEVFSSRMNPDFHCTGQMADSVSGVVRVSSWLMAMLWTECPHGGGGVRYGRHKLRTVNTCILSMEICMHRDTVMRSWGPLSCHSSATIRMLNRHVTHWACCVYDSVFQFLPISSNFALPLKRSCCWRYLWPKKVVL